MDPRLTTTLPFIGSQVGRRIIQAAVPVQVEGYLYGVGWSPASMTGERESGSKL